MQVGDLVKQNVNGLEKTGIIVSEVRSITAYHSRLFKVLWSTPSPALPTLIGPVWESKLELISESR